MSAFKNKVAVVTGAGSGIGRELALDLAAKTILDGVAAGRGRILVGRDARLIDKLVRVVPALYPRAVARLTATSGGR